MTVSFKQANYHHTEDGKRALHWLTEMSASTQYNTLSTYSANTAAYPDNQMPFVDHHMRYLSMHQTVNVDHYLANLRLLTRVR